MLRLHHAPMACSLASRFALAEAGLPYELAVVRTSRGENRTAAVAGRLAPLPNLDRFQQRMLARPALAAVLGEEMKLMAEA